MTDITLENMNSLVTKTIIYKIPTWVHCVVGILVLAIIGLIFIPREEKVKKIEPDVKPTTK